MAETHRNEYFIYLGFPMFQVTYKKRVIYDTETEKSLREI